MDITLLIKFFAFQVSFLYAFVVSWITAYTMVLVHERVPDKEKYPPLPDIFLDNIPLIPYAFKLAELCGLLLCFLFVLIIIFHKHRYVFVACVIIQITKMIAWGSFQ